MPTNPMANRTSDAEKETIKARLLRCIQKRDEAQAKLDAAVDRVCSEIWRAYEIGGLSYNSIAAATGLSRSRVYQVIDEQRALRNAEQEGA